MSTSLSLCVDYMILTDFKYQCGVSKALNGKSLSLKTHMAMCDVLGLKLDDVFSLVEEQ